MRKAHGGTFLIEVDGGVGRKNAGDLFKQEPTFLVAGSSVFKAENPEGEVEWLKSSAILSETAQ